MFSLVCDYFLCMGNLEWETIPQAQNAYGISTDMSI
jgi:hypothetical protein